MNKENLSAPVYFVKDCITHKGPVRGVDFCVDRLSVGRWVGGLLGQWDQEMSKALVMPSLPQVSAPAVKPLEGTRRCRKPSEGQLRRAAKAQSNRYE